jgi:hypothetical protein
MPHQFINFFKEKPRRDCLAAGANRIVYAQPNLQPVGKRDKV